MAMKACAFKKWAMFGLVNYFSLFAATAYSEIYTYRLHDLGTGVEANLCQANARATAQNLKSRAPGISIISAGCLRSEDIHGIEGKIVYSASQPVKIFRADPNMPFGIDGFFNKREDCEKTLTNEIDVFKQITKLEPIAAYCYQTIIGDSYGRFRTRIDAVGESSARKIVHDVYWSTKIEKPRELIEQVNQLFNIYGPKLVATIALRDLGQNRLAHAYYADHAWYLQAEQPLKFANPEDCKFAADSLGQQWDSTFKIRPSVFNCGTSSFDGMRTEIAHFYLSQEITTPSEFRLETLPELYDGLMACRTDEKRVQNELGSDPAIGLIATACGEPQEIGNVRMIAYFKRTTSKL